MRKKKQKNVKSTFFILDNIQDFELVFTKEDFDVLLSHFKQNHTIELIPGTELKPSKIYSLLPAKQSELDVFLVENLCTGHICSFKSLMVVLIFFIKKKNSSLQLVQDYKTLNVIMVKNQYLFPLISKLVSKL